MIHFLKSVELWATVILVVVAAYVFGIDRFSSIIQVLTLFGVSYAIHKHHRHHDLLTTLMDEEKKGE